MRSGPDPKIVLGLWDAQILKERLRHHHVVVLTGMHSDVPDVSALLKRTIQRRQLHEVGARADERENGTRARRYSSRTSTEERRAASIFR